GSEPTSVKTGGGFGAGAVAQFPRWQGVLEETDGLIVAADAEIYNRGELGAVPTDSSPAQVIAALYCKLGPAWMEKISGTFSAAIWDPSKRRLMLVTDRFGIRPLVYAEREGFLAFASRLRSVTRLPAIERRIRPESILNYLFYSMVPSPDTIFEGMHKLPAGHFLLWQEGRTEVGCYWDLAFPEENRSRSFFASCLRNELERAVGRVLSDSGQSGSVGCFLSGGTDSSTVTGMVGRLTGATPRTFSIGFDVPGYNEIEYARAVVRHFGAEHQEYFVSAEDTARAIPAIVAEYDEPFGNASAVPTLYCARMAQANGIRMMLAGDGGDELFGGNERYAREQVFDLYQEIPGFLRRGVIEPLLFSFPADAAVPLVDRARKYIRRATLPQPERFFSYNFLSEIPPGEVFSDDFLLAV
ncbi:MAG: asparagine synthetase B, partial [Acidobacteria bacterium]|nr:asparagine synthetase B [Acidobacteriota bacterium]